MKNCWLTKTPFQMGLILILLIAVPFLIAMIIVYVMYGAMGSRSIDCWRMCDNLKVFTRAPLVVTVNATETNATSTTPISTTTKKKRKRAVWGPRASVAALLENLYVDEETEQIFKCPAALLADGWALTVSGCIQTEISIRVGSDYWSKDGTVKKVDKIVHSNDNKLVLLQFEGTGLDGAGIGRVWSNKEVRLFKWDGGREVPLSKRRKYDELTGVNVGTYVKCNGTSFAKVGLSCFVYAGNDQCGSTMVAPMIDEDNYLVGFHVGTTCDARGSSGYYVDVNSYKEWIYGVLIGSSVLSNDSE